MTDTTEGKKGVEAEREPNFLLAPVERRFLPWAAQAPAALGPPRRHDGPRRGRRPRRLRDVTVLDVIGLGIVAVMLALLTVRAFGNLRELAREEPSAPRR
jgi:hypothetical protein